LRGFAAKTLQTVENDREQWGVPRVRRGNSIHGTVLASSPGCCFSASVTIAVGVVVGEGVGHGVGVGDAATTLKLTVIEAPLLPVAPVELHGVATNV
jgi:hypothetical protein